MATFQKAKWKQKTLSQLGFLGRGKSKHRPRNDASLYGGKYPFIQTSDIKHANFYVTSYSQTYNEEGLKQSKLWQKNTLCMTIAANIAETALLSFPACFPDSVVGFIADSEQSDVRFIKYALDVAKKSFQKRSKGTAQDNLSLEKIDNLKISVPSPKTQTRIASVLSAYDNLIENNEKRIKALEEMAQLLYTEWFVKFKFPGHEKVKMVESDTEYGLVPEGWEVKRLGAIVQIKKGKNITRDTIIDGNIPVVAGGLAPAYFHNTPNTKGPVVTVSASGANAGFTRLYFQDIWASDCSYIDTNLSKHVYFFYLFLKNKQEEISRLQRGSAQPHVYPKDLMELQIVNAPDRIIQKFSESISLAFDFVAKLSLENQNLSKTRDLLIPQLVTGKKELK